MIVDAAPPTCGSAPGAIPAEGAVIDLKASKVKNAAASPEAGWEEALGHGPIPAKGAVIDRKRADVVDTPARARKAIADG